MSDFGFKVLPSVDLAESANGRLVTMAVIGVFGQDGPTGSAWRDEAL
jgi:hypothetical protein